MQIVVSDKAVIFHHNYDVTMCRLLVAPFCEYGYNKKVEKYSTQTEWNSACKAQERIKGSVAAEKPMRACKVNMTRRHLLN